MNSQLNSRASESKVTTLDRCASSWIEIVVLEAFLIDSIAVSVFVDILIEFDMYQTGRSDTVRRGACLHHFAICTSLHQHLPCVWVPPSLTISPTNLPVSAVPCSTHFHCSCVFSGIVKFWVDLQVQTPCLLMLVVVLLPVMVSSDCVCEDDDDGGGLGFAVCSDKCNGCIQCCCIMVAFDCCLLLYQHKVCEHKAVKLQLH